MNFLKKFDKKKFSETVNKGFLAVSINNIKYGTCYTMVYGTIYMVLYFYRP